MKFNFIIGSESVSIDDRASMIAKHIGVYDTLWVDGCKKAEALTVTIRHALIRCVSEFNECVSTYQDIYYQFIRFLTSLLEVCQNNKSETVKISFGK